MAIKAWGPLFAWLVLAGAGINGLMAEHSEPHNRGQPTVAPHKDSHRAELAATQTDNQNGKKGEQERSWVEGLFNKPTDTFLVVFNGLLVLFTGLLYRATSGLFKETAELRRIAYEQRVDLSRSIIAAEKTAHAAKQSADVAEQTLSGTEAPFVFIIIAPADGSTIVTITSPQGVEYPEHVSYMLHNYGRSPAIIREIYIACIASDAMPGPCPFPRCKVIFSKVR
jgi:hypothetical protein